MSNPQVLLYMAAVIVLVIGAVLDSPRFNVLRCIALAMALIVLAQMPVLH